MLYFFFIGHHVLFWLKHFVTSNVIQLLLTNLNIFFSLTYILRIKVSHEYIIGKREELNGMHTR